MSPGSGTAPPVSTARARSRPKARARATALPLSLRARAAFAARDCRGRTWSRDSSFANALVRCGTIADFRQRRGPQQACEALLLACCNGEVLLGSLALSTIL